MTRSANHRLAVVVPAWKPTYLREALESIALHDGAPVDVFVFDDAGPSEIAAIAAGFPAFHYHRFDTNLGGTSLVAHWNRCLAMLDNEWVWLFSDDDVMLSGSVQSVLDAIAERPEARVLQLAVDRVSEDLQTILWQSLPPRHETASAFLKARLGGHRLSCLPDHVFHWHRLRQLNGGLVDLPLAWNADDATWLLLGRDAGLTAVPGAKVLWRQSGLNISNDIRQRWVKLAADKQFIDRVRRSGIADISCRRQMRHWLYRRLTDLYAMGWSDIGAVTRLLPLTWWPVVFAALARSSWHGAKRWVAPALSA